MKIRFLYPGILVSVCMAANGFAAEYRVSADADAPCQDPFSVAAARLQPGDTLILADGVYTQTCARRLTLSGTEEKPIIIAGENRNLARIYLPPDQVDKLNNLEVADSSHLVIRNLHFTGGSMGVRIMNGHHITLENNQIDQTGTVAIALNNGDSHHIVIRGNEISQTGLSKGAPGEAIYAGCHDSSCVVTESLFEENRIYELFGDPDGGNDGIELKPGSGGNVVRKNVISNAGANLRFPCIFAYGGGKRPNIIEANTLIECAEGIRVAADALVRNNLIIKSTATGIVAAPHEKIPKVENLSIINNTVFDSAVCAKLEWRTARQVIFANNALYCEHNVALKASGLSGHLVINNAWTGKLKGVDSSHGGFFAGQSARDDFLNTRSADFSPALSSRLRGRSEYMIPGAPAYDMHNKPRNLDGFATVGAIE